MIIFCVIYAAISVILNPVVCLMTSFVQSMHHHAEDFWFWSFRCCLSCMSLDIPTRLRSLQNLQVRHDKLENSFADLYYKVDSIDALVDFKIASLRASIGDEITSDIMEIRKLAAKIVICGLRESQDKN